MKTTGFTCNCVGDQRIYDIIYHFWRGIRRIKAIKCPPTSSPQGDINSNPIISKINRTQTLSLKLQQGGLRFGFGTLRDVYQN